MAAVALGQVASESYNGQAVVARQVLVKIPGSNPSLIQALNQLLDAQSARPVGTTGVHLFQSKSKTVQSMLVLLALQQVGYAEPNRILHTTKSPNDPSFSTLWGLQNTVHPGADIGAVGAWDVSTGSTANVVGVVDTGIDYTHPDLAANVWAAPAQFTVNIGGTPITCPAGSHGFNAIAKTCDPMDDNSHGSHVSGTIGAVGNNSLGVTGINWTTRIMGLKFLDNSGSGATSDAIDAIDFALQVKAYFANSGTPVNLRAFSNSYAGDGFSQAFVDELNKANTADVLFVAAAANSSSNNDTTPVYPGNYSTSVPNVITVSATDQNDTLASFSNYGTASVHLGAPGVNILSTVPGGGYAYYSGTSMATPHVTGAAMLLLSACTLSTASLKQTILANVDADPALAGKTITGGRLNVRKAIQACSGGSVFAPIRVNAGGSAYTDTSGNQWSADYGFSGGSTFSTGNGIAGTSDPALYRSERFNFGTLQYSFNVPNGNYSVTLKFAEIYFQSPGQRLFNIAINGTTVQPNFDIIAAGGANVAVDRTYNVAVSTGQIVIQLVSALQNPKISAIQIVAGSAQQPISVTVAPPNVTLGPSGTQQFTASVANTANQNVTWSISPVVGTISAGGSYQAPASIAAQQTVTVKATSAVDNTTYATATVTLQPPGASFTPIRVNAGGPAYTDTQGQLWSADYGFSGGTTFATGSFIAATADPALYQSERYNSGALQYQFTVPNGNYAVTLKFAEIYFQAAGQRVFNIVINGATVLSNFDPFAQAGGSNKAVDRFFNVSVTGGQITIQLVGVIQNPKISAIQILSGSGSPIAVTVTPPGVTLGPSATQQFSAAVANAANQNVTWSMSPQVGTISATGNYQAPAIITTQQNVTIKATSAVDNTTFGTATLTLQVPTASFTPIRINAGGVAYTDSLGQVWSADSGFNGGLIYGTNSFIAGTSTPALYQSERFSGGTLQYQFAVPNGSYTVTLKFAEIYFQNAGQRVFNILINGNTVTPNFDPLAQAGGINTAVDKSYTVPVTNAQLTIQLVSVVQNAKISAIQITSP